MNIIHKIGFDENGIYEEKFLYNGQYITQEQFEGIAADLKDDGYCDYNCEDCEIHCKYDDVEEIQCNCPECTCDNEPEYPEDWTDEMIAEYELLQAQLELLLDTKGCPDCLFDLLLDISNVWKNVGWKDHQDYIREMNED
jgi:hypothetical protein